MKGLDATNVVSKPARRNSARHPTAPTAHGRLHRILPILLPTTLYVIGFCEFFRWQIIQILTLYSATAVTHALSPLFTSMFIVR
jgi:hypothetical protein